MNYIIFLLAAYLLFHFVLTLVDLGFMDASWVLLILLILAFIKFN